MKLGIVFCVDINEDQFEKRAKERKEKIAKNEYQRLRNIDKNRKGNFEAKGKVAVWVCLKGNCNAKIKNSFMLEIDSSICIHDMKNNFRFLTLR